MKNTELAESLGVFKPGKHRGDSPAAALSLKHKVKGHERSVSFMPEPSFIESSEDFKDDYSADVSISKQHMVRLALRVCSCLLRLSLLLSPPLP